VATIKARRAVRKDRRFATEPVISCGSPSAERRDRGPHHPWEVPSPRVPWEDASLPVPPMRGPAVPWAEAAWKLLDPDD
jgi:hypothetical protein